MMSISFDCIRTLAEENRNLEGVVFRAVSGPLHVRGSLVADAEESVPLMNPISIACRVSVYEKFFTAASAGGPERSLDEDP